MTNLDLLQTRLYVQGGMDSVWTDADTRDARVQFILEGGGHPPHVAPPPRRLRGAGVHVVMFYLFLAAALLGLMALVAALEPTAPTDHQP